MDVKDIKEEFLEKADSFVKEVTDPDTIADAAIGFIERVVKSTSNPYDDLILAGIKKLFGKE